MNTEVDMELIQKVVELKNRMACSLQAGEKRKSLLALSASPETWESELLME
jgi:hypothetical protein